MSNPLDGMFTEMQGMAVGLHEFYRSLVAAGFTEEQALSILNSLFVVTVAAQQGGQ